MNSASLFYKMMISRLYDHLSENEIGQFKLDKLTDYLTQTSQYGEHLFCVIIVPVTRTNT